MMVNVAICDDDIEALNSEAAIIEELFVQKNIECQLTKYNSSKKLLDSDIKYDMLFLDIEMDEINGIELAKNIYDNTKNCFVFFITNYSVYLDKAFDVHAIRYLNKPVDRFRLSDGIDRAIEQIQNHKKKISVTRMKNRLKISIEISNIIYISNTGRHTEIVTTMYDIFEVEEIFSTVKNMIEKEVNYFCQPHQSFYVNLSYVCQYTKDTVTMSYSDKMYKATMTRRRYKEFDEKFFLMANKIK